MLQCILISSIKESRMMTCLLIFGFLNIVLANQISSSKLVDKAVQITTKYYKDRFVTSVVWASNNSEEVSDFLTKYTGSVVLFDVNNNAIINTIEHSGYTQSVFFATESEIFDNFLSLVSENVRVSMRLVLVFEKPIKDIFELSTFMRIAWKNDLVNIVVISIDDSDEVIISTYYPFSNGKCDNDLPVKLDPDENMFPNKFKNFNKCPIKTIALYFLPYVDMKIIKSENGIVTEIGGYDGITLSLIVHKLNATLNVNIDTVRDYGTFSEGNATGGFYDLVHKKADMLLPAGILTLDRYLVSQSTHAYHTVDIRWIGPKRRKIYNGLKLLLPFMDIVTPVLCLTFFTYVFVALLIIRRDKLRYERKKNLSLQTFALLLGQTVNFETKMTFLNNFFMFWIWFSFIIRIAYQGDLVQSLQNELLEPPFTTLDDAVTRVNGFGGSPIFQDYYKGTQFEHNYKMLELAEIRYYFESIAVGERFLLATDTFLVHDIRHSLQILDTQINSAAAYLYMRPGWPAAQMIDAIVVHLVESGIVEQIRTSRNTVSHQQINEDSKVRALDMTLLCACFYGLGLMGVLCSLIFVIELMYDQYTYIKCRYKQSIA